MLTPWADALRGTNIAKPRADTPGLTRPVARFRLSKKNVLPAGFDAACGPSELDPNFFLPAPWVRSPRIGHRQARELLMGLHCSRANVMAGPSGCHEVLRFFRLLTSQTRKNLRASRC